MHSIPKYFGRIISLLLSFTFFTIASLAQYTHQDSLRGSVGPGRDWWDVKYYSISVIPDYTTKTIRGKNSIRFEWLKPSPSKKFMQIDLQSPMIIDSVIYQQQRLKFEKDGNTWNITWPITDHLKEENISIYFHGRPREAVNPPWDGGWIWKKDEMGRPWMTVACQGLGASVWYPSKDYQGDEPDNGASLIITVPDSLVAVGNGRLKNKTVNQNRTISWEWEVKNPINNYNIVPYIGYYTNWTEKYAGIKGNLDCSYWVLDYNLEKSKQQFGRDVKLMLRCFEDWFGPYPFYEDSYKLVETPHLGMEHQSGVAYGNEYKNGYLGIDRSRTGWGTKWDYIIVHESGHEWFGNNITTKDVADMWVHEGFTTYSETIFTECRYGKKAADAYTQGLRRNIDNDHPIIGPYGVNQEGSGDMYDKGSNLIHTIRQVINNDNLFKEILRGLNKDFYHKIVTSADIEKYITQKSKKDLSAIFGQYLRTTQIPVLEWKVAGKNISYRWSDCIARFNMPVKLKNGTRLSPTVQWKNIAMAQAGKSIVTDENFYVKIKKL
ncbi:MAG: M1 family metallopeptidase [Chitinophagaceae bacterium]